MEHKVDGSKYAVKKLEKISENIAESEVEEAKQMCSMLHANVCRYYNAWQEDGFVHIRMELCDKDLATWINTRNRVLFGNEQPREDIEPILERWIDLSWDRSPSGTRPPLPSQQTWFRSIKSRGTNDFLKGLLKGVRYLHDDKGVAHQDLHPKNVLLKIDYAQNTITAKICDFGLARRKNTTAFSEDRRFENRPSPTTVDSFCQDLESLGRIMMRMYYPLYGNAMNDLLSKLQKSSRNHETELNCDFRDVWPNQALWIKRLLSGEEVKPTAAQMLDQGMRSETFPSEKYKKGLEDGEHEQRVACYVQQT